MDILIPLPLSGAKSTSYRLAFLVLRVTLLFGHSESQSLMKVKPADQARVESSVRSTVRNTLLVAMLVLAGRFSGFAREWMIAARGGASESTDVAIVLLTFPDLMVSLLLGGGLAATLVPAFKRCASGEDASLLLRATLWIGGAFVMLVAVLALMATEVLGLLAPGLPDPVRQQNVSPFLVMLLALPLSALSGVVVAFLNAHGRFAAGASGTLMFNGAVIACVFLVGHESIAYAIAFGVAAGALLRLTVQGGSAWPAVQWRGLLPRGDAAALLKQFAGTFSFVTVLVVLSPVSRAVASLHDEGALSLFNFATKLVDLPMGVLIGSLGAVMLPKVSGDFVAGGYSAARPALLLALKAAFWASIAILIPSMVFPDVLVELAFYGAAFSPEQSALLADLVRIAFLSLPFQSLLSIYGTAFAAAGATRLLVKVAALMLVVVVVLSPLALSLAGVQGVMAVHAAAYMTGAAAMTWLAGGNGYFGRGLVAEVLGEGRASLVWPLLAGSVIALAGTVTGGSLWARAVWATATLGGFGLAVIVCNPGPVMQWMRRKRMNAR
jgi:putative peptidoglycan lipid II flippase